MVIIFVVPFLKTTVGAVMLHIWGSGWQEADAPPRTDEFQRGEVEGYFTDCRTEHEASKGKKK